MNDFLLNSIMANCPCSSQLEAQRNRYEFELAVARMNTKTARTLSTNPGLFRTYRQMFGSNF
jgi:hypothetical protein